MKSGLLPRLARLPESTHPHLHGQAGAQVHNKDGHGLPPVIDNEDEVLPFFVFIQDTQECCRQKGQGWSETLDQFHLMARSSYKSCVAILACPLVDTLVTTLSR